VVIGTGTRDDQEGALGQGVVRIFGFVVMEMRKGLMIEILGSNRNTKIDLRLLYIAEPQTKAFVVLDRLLNELVDYRRANERALRFHLIPKSPIFFKFEMFKYCHNFKNLSLEIWNQPDVASTIAALVEVADRHELLRSRLEVIPRI